VTAAALEAALASLGVPCAVDAEQRLAVLRPTVSATNFAQPAMRARIVALAQEHGFTHVALDLADVHSKGERRGAVVSGD
jgi:predicted kinase